MREEFGQFLKLIADFESSEVFESSKVLRHITLSVIIF